MAIGKDTKTQCNFQAENSGWAILVLLFVRALPPPSPIPSLPFSLSFPSLPFSLWPPSLLLKRRSGDVTPGIFLKFYIAAGEF